MRTALNKRRSLDPVRTGDQYRRQLKRLADDAKSTKSIEIAVEGAVRNLQLGARHKALIIYGEPQSGKTEMMICLTARLLDEGFSFIVHLLTDSIGPLEQNLGRFQASGLVPAAQHVSEMPDIPSNVASGRFVVFGTKNEGTIRQLIARLCGKSGVVVIDEAESVAARSKVAQDRKFAINGLIQDIVRPNGCYIRVTSTPLRVNVGRTFKNDSPLWIAARPHSAYSGQDQFFPMQLYTQGVASLPYRLTLLPDQGDDATHQKHAVLRFLIHVAHLNLSTGKERNFSMLAHTGSVKAEYKLDLKNIQTTLDILSDQSDPLFKEHIKRIWGFAKTAYTDVEADHITEYVIKNVGRNSIFVIASEAAFNKCGHRVTNPSSLFTIVIGGNIVSRGVTFNNLLAIFFPRDVKRRLKQDSYIRRARMFGNRSGYLDHFELTIPQAEYFDWHRCFVYHRLALASIEAGLGSPVWIGDRRIAAVSSPSADQSTVDMDCGEMSFAMFRYDRRIDQELTNASTPAETVEVLQRFLPEPSFPAYLRSFILQATPGNELGLRVLPTANVFPSMSEDEKARIGRRRGFLTIREQDYAGGTVHFLQMFKNRAGRSRLFYKIGGAQRFLNPA